MILSLHKLFITAKRIHSFFNSKFDDQFFFVQVANVKIWFIFELQNRQDNFKSTTCTKKINQQTIRFQIMYLSHILSAVIQWKYIITKFLFTGSTIRNWHKVKTWLDQMFWQIYQKLMLSGFLSSWNLCLIYYLKIFWPQRPLSERVPYISEKLDFWWTIPQKIASIGYLGASDDQIIRIRKFFGEIRLSRLLRPVRLQRPLRSMRLERFLRPWKSLLWTSESSWFLNSII